MFKFPSVSFTIVVCVGALLGVQRAAADIVCISDLTEGAPTVTVFTGGTCAAGVNDVTASRVTIRPDSGSEFLDFTLALGPNPGVSGVKFVTDLWEDVVGGTLSDVLLQSYQNPISMIFCSDPVFCNPAGYTLLPQPGQPPGLLEQIENGQFQYEGSFGNTDIGSGGYTFFVQSDLDPTPEPGLLFPIATTFAALYVLRRRRGIPG